VPVRAEQEARQIGEVGLVGLFGQGRCGCDAAFGEQIGKVVIQLLDGPAGEGVTEPDDQIMPHPAVGNVVAVKCADLLHGVVHAGCQPEQIEIGGAYQAVIQEVFSSRFRRVDRQRRWGRCALCRFA